MTETRRTAEMGSEAEQRLSAHRQPKSASPPPALYRTPGHALCEVSYWRKADEFRMRVPLRQATERHGRRDLATSMREYDQSAPTQRAAASAVSCGRVLKAIAAFGAPLWIAFTTRSKNGNPLGGMRRPPPITTQS